MKITDGIHQDSFLPPNNINRRQIQQVACLFQENMLLLIQLKCYIGNYLLGERGGRREGCAPAILLRHSDMLATMKQCFKNLFLYYDFIMLCLLYILQFVVLNIIVFYNFVIYIFYLKHNL